MEVAPLKTFTTEIEARSFAKANKGVDEVIVKNDKGTFDVYAADKLDPKTLEKLKVGSAATTVIFEVEKKGGPGSAARIPQKDFEAAGNALGVTREKGESTDHFNRRVQTEVNRTLLRATPPQTDSLLVVDGLAGPKTLDAVKKAYAIKSQKIETPGFKEDDAAIAKLKVVAPPPPPKPVPKADGTEAPKPTFTGVKGKTGDGNYVVTDAGTGLDRLATPVEKALIDKALAEADPPPAPKAVSLAPVVSVGDAPPVSSPPPAVFKGPTGLYLTTDSATGLMRPATAEEKKAYDEAQPVKPLFGPGGTFQYGGVGVISPGQSKAFGIDTLLDPSNPKKVSAVPLDGNGLPMGYSGPVSEYPPLQ